MGCGHSRLSTTGAKKLERYNYHLKILAVEIVTISMLQVVDWLVEYSLGTHDVAIPISKTREGDDGVFRFVLLSAIDVGSPNTWHRMERLYHLEGGCYCAVVLLLQEGGDEHVMTPYMALQTRYGSTSRACEDSSELTMAEG